MKYLVLVGDGMADWPIAALGNKTPLEVASTPSMDELVRRGITGSAHTIPENYPAGSDVANMTLFGYDPALYYTGRSPLEAASIGVQLGAHDISFRCNLVTLEPNGSSYNMADFSAYHIPSQESVILIETLNRYLSSDDIRFYAGTSYRHLLVWQCGARIINLNKLTLTPPHDISGHNIAPYLPSGDGQGVLLWLMHEARNILPDHPINHQRAAQGLKRANGIWFWGAGTPPKLPLFQEKYNLKGAIISAVDLLKGLGIYLGLDIIEVPGATGYLDTNYNGKAQYAIEALKTRNFVFLHIEAPDEASHEGSWEKKVQALEDFDSKVVGPLLSAMGQFEEYKILLTTDHLTPVSLKTHASGAVPFAIFSPKAKTDGTTKFDESLLTEGSLHFPNGYELMDYYIFGKYP
jgi:2,3-bisphosphoglycerate-independent phosphoglycerate mutase